MNEVKFIQKQAHSLSPQAGGLHFQNILELKLGSRTALMILQAAIMRKESRGAHFREDFPYQNDSRWKGHISVCLDRSKTEQWSFERIE